MTNKLSLAHLPVEGKKVLMRVDFNVPLNREGEVSDATRIEAAAPSMRHVLDAGASLILMSHLGRPKGQPSSELSLACCVPKLKELLGSEVIFAEDCIGPEVETLAKNLQPGQVLLLENLRFHRAETKPSEDPSFAQKLASLADCYVNEAFSASHREHSSVSEVPKLFPEKSATGFLLEKEIEYLGTALSSPKRPLIAVIGGAKVSTKIGVLEALTEKVDGLFIGGAMIFTFLKAQGISVGRSLCEDDYIDTAKRVLKLCKERGVDLRFPADTVCVKDLSAPKESKLVPTQEGVPDGWMGVDIGPEAIADCRNWLRTAGTILWNGPVGVFEVPPLDKGTRGIAEAITNCQANTIVGGGDSIAALRAANAINEVSHVSTGGGACLEYIQFGRLPGIDALSNTMSLQS